MLIEVTNNYLHSSGGGGNIWKMRGIFNILAHEIDYKKTFHHLIFTKIDLISFFDGPQCDWIIQYSPDTWCRRWDSAGGAHSAIFEEVHGLTLVFILNIFQKSCLIYTKYQTMAGYKNLPTVPIKW